MHQQLTSEEAVIVNTAEFMRCLKQEPFHYVRKPRSAYRTTICDDCLTGGHSCRAAQCPCVCNEHAPRD